jgi:hypothetical protein
MSRVIRILLVLLLATALPVRGVAGATMLFCAQAGSAVAAEHAAAHAMNVDDHAMHDTDAHAAHHEAQSETGATNDAPQSPDENLHAGCSTSGACCTGVAAGPLFPQPAGITPLAPPIPFRAPLYASVDLDHAERPPLA